MVWTAPEVTRVDEPFVADERTALDGWLDWQRSTLLHKCAGLTGEQLGQRTVPPSNLSLHGLIRHMTDVERAWFRRRFRGEQIDAVYWADTTQGPDFDDLDPARAEADYAAFVAEVKSCRAAVADAGLDDTFVHPRLQVPIQLRWVYIHMIEEYARHNGHADLLRECTDGVTGA